MESKRKSEEHRENKAEDPEKEPDDYTPAVLAEGPKKYRFDDWASI